MADKLLKSIKFPTLPDRYVIGDTSLSEEGAAAEAKAVGEALATKADTKGRYEDLIVGGAEQLMADEYETDKEPYLFRTTGGSADVGNREYLDKIVGGTVGWNQLLTNAQPTRTINGVTFTNNEDGTYTVNGTATADATFALSGGSGKPAHKVLLCGCPAGGSPSSYMLWDGYAGWSDSGNGTVKPFANSGNWGILITVKSGITVDNIVFKPQLFDLTALFNPTIADYIYSLERSQAGAGVAWFRQYFPKDYYEYNSGTLRSVEGVSAHETVGFNQWDEEWELGGIDLNTGVNTENSNHGRSKNYIRCFPNTTYYYRTDNKWASFRFYDSDKNFLGAEANRGVDTNVTFVTPAGSRYMRFEIQNNVNSKDICINLSDPSRNGEYEPYQKHTYPLDSSLTLRGVPKLVDGKLAYDGDIYPPSGEVDRRYGLADLGTLNWSYYDSVFYVDLADKVSILPSASDIRMMCSKYAIVPRQSGMSPSEDGVIYEYSGGNPPYLRICVRDDSFNGNVANFKAAMSGVYLVYEKATPTTETADGYEQYQRCDPSGTEEFVTDSIVPVSHETRYPHDLKKKIETAPDSPSADGTYLMKRSGGKNAYMALPSTPSANGAYVLTVTVSGGTASYSWTAKE